MRRDDIKQKAKPKASGASRQPPLAGRASYSDEDDNQATFGGWLLPLRPQQDPHVLLVCREGAYKNQLQEALEQRGHQVTPVRDGTEAIALCEQQRFEVALLLCTERGVPVLMQQLRALDPDLEVVWVPPPVSVAQAEALVQEAVDRGNQRLLSLYQAARLLLVPLPPDDAAGRLLEQAEDILGGSAELRAHETDEPQQVLLSPDRRRLRVPLWNGGPAPEETPEEGASREAEEDSGHRLDVCRSPHEPELSRADLLRAGVLCTVGSLALTRAHCEEALSELYHEVGELRKDPAPPTAPEAQAAQQQGRGLTSSAIGPLERLAGVLAHELNNPLTFVLANLSCLKEELAGLRQALARMEGTGSIVSSVKSQCDEMEEVLNEALGGAGRVREVVADLTTLGARGDSEGPQHPVMIDDVVRAALRIARREVQRRAQVVLDIEPRLPPVTGSASRLGQVILNLLLNAVQAVPHGDATAHEVRIRARAQGDFVTVGISDTGSGIAADTLPRVFEPGYTTKPLGEGSGLGLAISREIVRAHGGEIQIESKPGKGTTVTVVLPIHKSADRTAGGSSARNS